MRLRLLWARRFPDMSVKLDSQAIQCWLVEGQLQEIADRAEQIQTQV